MASLVRGFEIVVTFVQEIYTYIFPEFPAIGAIIILIALLTMITRLMRKEPVGESMGAGLKIFVTLTILFFFLHWVIRLFLALQVHSL